MAQAYLSRWDGPASEADDPYRDYDDRPSPGGPPQYYVREVLEFDTDAELKNGLMTYGAISTSMYMDTAYYNSSTNTYFYNGAPCPDPANHGVTIVGWNDNLVVPGAPRGAWLVKNSWGPTWGNAGYFWISYYDNQGANDGFCFCDAVSPDTYQKVYYYDDFGWVDSWSSPYAFNAFTATSDQDLAAVQFWTRADEAGYDVRVYDTFSGGSLAGLLGSTTGTCTFAGAHTVNLPTPVPLTAGNDFYVYLHITNGGSFPLAADSAFPGYSSACTASARQSYYSSDGTSWTDLYTTVPTGNFCIKALVTTTAPPEITVLGNGIAINDGDMTPNATDGTDLGSVTQGATGISRTFTVRNDGTGTLTLGRVTVPTGFTWTEGLPLSLAPGMSADFTIRLDTTTRGIKSGNVMVTNDDPDEHPFNFQVTGTVVTLPQVMVTVAPSGVAEDGTTNLAYTFTWSAAGSSPLTVSFGVGGTATFGTDYSQNGAASFSATSGTVVIGANQTTATVTVDPTADPTVEPDETVILTVTAAAGYTVGSPSTGTGTIQNDDVSGNLAFGKAAAASTSHSGFPASNATDGDLSSRWSSQFSDNEWLSADLGSVFTIHRVVLRWEAAYGRGYKLQVSTDASTWSDAYSTTTGDGGVDDITLSSSASSRYVRMLGTQRATMYGYSLYEMEVYGGGAGNHAPAVSSVSKSLMQDTPLSFAAADFAGAFADPDAGDSLQKIKITSLPSQGVLRLNGTAVTVNQEITAAQIGTLVYTPSSGYTGSDSFQWNGSDGSLYAGSDAAVNLSIQAAAANLALHKPAAASASYSGLPPSNATDGNVNSRWSSQFSDNEWLHVDLGSVYTIRRVVLRWETAYGRDYKLQVSSDASSWSDVYTTAAGDGGVDDLTLAAPASGRYVRMLGAQRGTPYGYSLYELEVYGGGGSGVPEITVLGNEVSIADGDVTPSATDGTDFGSAVQGGAAVSRAFTVRNDGTAALTLGAVAVPTGFTLTEGLSGSLAPGASDTFTVRLETTTGGTQAGDLSFATNDSDEDPFNFRVTGTVNAASANLALGKAATASMSYSGLPPAHATDGNVTSRWSSRFSNNEWLYVDLGSTFTINRIVLRWEAAYGRGYKLQVSDDASNWSEVYSTTTGDGGVDDLTLAAPVSGRYVRMLGTQRATAYGYSLWELEVYGAAGSAEIAVLGSGVAITDGDTTPSASDGTDFGTVAQGGTAISRIFTVRNDGTATLTLGAATVPVGFTLTEGLSSGLAPGAADTFTVQLNTATVGTPTGEISFSTNDSDENPFNFRITGIVNGAANLALGKTAAASTTYSGLPASNATDGNTASRWSSQFSDSQWLSVDLGSVDAIHRVVLRWEAAYGRGYGLQVSDDASHWSEVYSTTTGDGGVDDITLSSPAPGRYVRMLGTQRATAYGYSLWELEVYGAAGNSEITVLGNGVTMTEGDTTPSTSDGTDFGSVAQGAAAITQAFTARNDGTATLTLGAVTVPAGYTLTEGLSGSLAAGASDTFTVRLDTATTGTKAGDVSFSTNDADENPFYFRITGVVAVPMAPEIAVYGNGMSIPDGDATPGTGMDEVFGYVIQGGPPVQHTFRVRNEGTATLTLGPITVPTGFTLAEGLSDSLAPGVSDTFTVQLDTAALGTKSGDVSFANNDADENPFNFRIIGWVVGPEPEITVLGNEVEIADGDTTPSATDGTDFGSVLQGAPVVSHIFTVRNDGGSALALGAVTVPAGFTVTSLRSSIPTGEWAEFTVQLDTAELGTKSGEVSFSTNDSDENPFHFRITGEVISLAGPEITVLGNGVPISDGDKTPSPADDTDFGGVAQGGSAISHTFTVRNDGTATLTLGAVTVPPGFTLTEGLSPSLAAGVSDTFTVRLDAAIAGIKTRDIAFATNDGEESPFNFRVTGTVRDPRTEIIVLGNGVSINDGDTTPSATDHTDFGSVVGRYNSPIRRTFTVRNDGTAPLTLGPVSVPTGYTLTRGLPLAIAPGASDTFTVQLDVVGDFWYGIKSGDVSFVTNDNDESPFNFRITGEVTVAVGPEITVSGDWEPIADGDTTPSPYDHTDFGPVARGGTPATCLFRARNDGVGILTLGPVTVPTGFTLTEGLSTSLGLGEADTFLVQLDTETVGTKSGDVSFVTNDPDANLFNFRIFGEVIDRVVPQPVPYGYDFNGNFLRMSRPDVTEGWEYYSSAAEGQIRVTNGRLRLDTVTENGPFSLNEAILHLDLTGQSNVQMVLDHWNLGDENTPLPSSFMGHYSGDGIALSVDGVHWVKVMDLAGDFTAWSFVLDTFVEQAKTYAGRTDVSDVRVKFQQYGNSSAFFDGREFDNIATTQPTQPVHFADPNLKAAVERALGLSNPRALDMLRLTELDIGGVGISDLTGLEYAKYLYRLYAPGNQISDLAPLSGTRLIYLDLDNNRISDLGPLSHLVRMYELHLNNNQISDLAPLAGCVELNRLELNDNRISGLGPIASLTRLSWLEVCNNAIVDISPLRGLDGLAAILLDNNQIGDIGALAGVRCTRLLYLSNNQISDISPLWGEDFRELHLNNNHIRDMTPVCWADNLEILWLDDNEISRIPPLARLGNLEILQLHYNQINDLSGLQLSGLAALWYLDLIGNQITDLSPLSSLTGLPGLALYLIQNQISDLHPLASLINLTALSLPENQIRDLSPLSGLVNLKFLHLDRNQISDIRPVSGLVQLETLALGHNQISDLSPLSSLINLGTLGIYDNQIRDLRPLSGLVNLSWLSMFANQIRDISPLAGFHTLQALYMHANPLNAEAYTVYIPMIVVNNPGITLTFDPQQPVSFADPRLKAAVEEALGLSHPTAADMLSLTELNAASRAITSLGGLEGADNLALLRLGNNQISDIHPISGLVKLGYVDLGQNPLNLEAYSIYLPQILANNPGVTLLYDVAQPVHFADPHLKALVEETLGLSDPSPANMLLLAELNGENRGISDLTGLEYAQNLTTLTLPRNQVRDVSPIAGLVQLGYLRLDYNQVSDIGPLAGLTGLTMLELIGNRIGDIRPLSGLANLHILRLSDNQIFEIYYLAGLTSLVHVDLQQNPLNSAAYDLYIPQILTNNPGVTLSYDAKAQPVSFPDLNLKALVEETLGVSDPIPGDMLGLTQLNGESGGRGISDLTGLEYAKNLTSLGLPRNQVSDVSPIAGLVNLGYLRLDYNQVSDLGPLAGLTGLAGLELIGNQISDIRSIAALTNVRILRLSENQISDISPLAELTHLLTLELYTNPLNAEAYSTYIPLILAHNPGLYFGYDPPGGGS